jgi:hypothetical protein
LRRLDLLAWAIPIGLATGLAAWLFAGGASAGLGRLDAAESQLFKLKPPAARRAMTEPRAADLLTAPLFALTTGPGAVREPSIRLDGVSLNRRRAAALVSVDGKPAAWMQPGESTSGVTLQAVTGSSASFETALGSKTLNLGEQSAESAPDPQARPTTGPVVADQTPTGLRGPPEPASAPKRR